MNPMQQPPSTNDDAHHARDLDMAMSGIYRDEPDAASFGIRLSSARKARGLSIESCAHALKLPTRVLRQLENNQHEGLDSRIYLGSYVLKYGRYLGVDEASIQQEVGRIRQPETPLVATGGMSHSRFLFDRYRTAAMYLVLTGAIVVPTIWLGVRGTLDRDLTHLAPLDASPVAQVELPAKPTGAAPDTAATGVPAQAVDSAAEAAASSQQQPLMASMAPFPNLGRAEPAAPVQTPVSDGHLAAHSLTLSLTAPSWVEVTASDGSRLEYGLLQAGTSKTYHADQPVEVRIGNVSGTHVSIDGQPVALDDFRRANVAHFRMQVEDGKASAGSL